MNLFSSISRMLELNQTMSPEDYNAFLDTLPASNPRCLFSLEDYSNPVHNST